MLESLVAGVLNKSLGWLLEDVNAENLRMAISNGDILLNELKIRSQALDSVENPFEVLHATCGKLRIRIPWSSIYSSPTVIEIEDIFVQLKIKLDHDDLVPTDERAERIKAMDMERRARLNDFSMEVFSPDQASGTSSWTGRLISQLQTNIAKNLCVSVKRIHFQLVHENYGVGLVIDEISLLPFDPVGTEDKGNNGGSGAISKVGKCDGIRIYFSSEYDSRTFSTMDMHNQETYATTDNLDLVLKELNVHILIEELYLEPNDVGKPMAKLAINVDAVHFAVDYDQLHALSLLSRVLSGEMDFVANRGLKPKVRPNVDPTGWWHFAIGSIMKKRAEHRRKFGWHGVIDRLKLRNEYVELYAKKCTGPGSSASALDMSKSLSTTDAQRLQEIERLVTSSTIMAFRTLVELEMVQRYWESKNSGFTERWLTWGSMDVVEARKRRCRELAAQFLNYHKFDDSTYLADVEFALHESSFTLKAANAVGFITSAKMDLLRAVGSRKGTVTTAKVDILDFRIRNGRTGSEMVYFDVHAMEDEGMDRLESDSDSENGSASSTDVPSCVMLELTLDERFENPNKVDVKVLPFALWIDFPLILAIQEFTDPPKSHSMQAKPHVKDSHDTLIEHFDTIRSYNEGMRKDAERNLKQTELSISVVKPKIVLARSAHTGTDVMVDALVLDFCSISISNSFEDVQKSGLTMTNVEVDKFQVQLNRVLTGSATILNREPVVVLEPLTFTLDIGASICPSDPTIPLSTQHFLFKSTFKLHLNGYIADQINLLKAEAASLSETEETEQEDENGYGAPVMKSSYELFQRFEPPSFLSPQQVRILRENFVSSRNRFDFDHVCIVLEDSHHVPECMIHLRGRQNIYVSETQPFLNRLYYMIDSINIENRHGTFSMMKIENLYYVKNVLEPQQRPFWMGQPSFYGLQDPREAKHIAALDATKSFTDAKRAELAIRASMDDFVIQTEEKFVHTFLEIATIVNRTPKELEKNGKMDPPAPPSPDTHFVQVLMPSMSIHMLEIDMATRIATFHVSEIEIGLKNSVGDINSDNFCANMSIDSMKFVADDGEGVLWNHSAWADETNGGNFVEFSAHRKENQHAAEVFQTRFYVKSPRVSLAAPLLNRIVVHALNVLPPQEEGEPIVVPNLDLDVAFMDFVIMFPKNPSLPSISWKIRDMAVLRWDNLHFAGNVRVPEQKQTTPEGITMSSSAQGRRAGFHKHGSTVQDEGDLFFDARSNSTSSDDMNNKNNNTSGAPIKQQQRQQDVPPMPDAVRIDCNWTNLAVETWKFRDELYQTVLRTSIAATVNIDHDERKIRGTILPVTLSCSQIQYALFLDIMVYNPLAQVIPDQQQQGTAEPASPAESLTTLDDQNTAERLVLFLAIEGFHLSLFRDDGGDNLPKWTDSNDKPSMLYASNTRKNKHMLAVQVGEMKVHLTQDSKENRGEGNVTIESFDIYTYPEVDDDCQNHVLRTDRKPFWETTVLLDGEDSVKIQSQLANIEMDAFEIRCALTDFAQVQNYLAVFHADTMMDDEDEAEEDMMMKEEQFLRGRSSYTEANNGGGHPAPSSSRIIITKTVKCELKCDNFQVALTPTTRSEGMLFLFSFCVEATTVKSKNARVKTAVKSMQLVRCTFSKRKPLLESMAYILRPVSLECVLNVHTPPVNSTDDDLVNGTISIGQVQVDLGRDDYELIMTANVEPDNVRERGRSGTNNLHHHQQQQQQQQPPPASNPGLPPIQHRQVNIGVKLDGISMVLYQDWIEYSPPIVQVAVDLFQVDLAQYDFRDLHAQTRVDVQAQGGLSYWNVHSGVYEPLVEPWFVKVSVDTPEFSRDSPKERIVKTLYFAKDDPVMPISLASSFVRVESPQMFNVNVTPSGLRQVELVSTFFASFDEEIAQNPSRRSNLDIADFDFIVRNQCGLHLRASVYVGSNSFDRFALPSSVNKRETHLDHDGCWAWKSDPTGAIWKRRFVAVHGGSLKYFKSIRHLKQGKPAGTIALYHRHDDDRESRPYLEVRNVVGGPARRLPNASECAFQLVTQKRTYNFVTYTVEDKSMLMGAILNAFKPDGEVLDVFSAHVCFCTVGRDKLLLRLEAYTLSLYPSRTTLSQIENQGDEESLALLSIDLTKFCALRKSMTGDGFKLIGPTFQFNCVYSEEDNKGEPLLFQDSLITRIERTREPNAFSSSSSSSSTQDQNDEQQQGSVIGAGKLDITLSIEMVEARSFLKTNKLHRVQVWLLPAGIRGEANLTTVNESEETIKISLSISNKDQSVLKKSQLIRLEFFSQNDPIVKASGYMFYHSLSTRQDLDRETSLKIFKSYGSFNQTDFNRYWFNVDCRVLASDDLLSVEGSRDEGTSSDLSFRKLDPGLQIGMNFQSLPTNEEQSSTTTFLELRTAQNQVVGPFPTESSGKYGLSLRVSEEEEQMMMLQRGSDQKNGEKSGGVSFERMSILPKYVVCDIHYEEGKKYALISSNSMIKNRLSTPVPIIFGQLYPNLPYTTSTVTRKFWVNMEHAFDGRTDTYWSSNVRAANCFIEYNYLDKVGERTVSMYSIASAKSGAAPCEWVVEGLCQSHRESDDPVWVKLDERKEVMFTKPLQVRTFAMKTVAKASAYRFTFKNGSPIGKTAEEKNFVFDISVGNVVLYSQERVETKRTHGEKPEDHTQKVILQPGETTHIPIEKIIPGGTIQFGMNGKLILVNELLHINPWKISSVYKRRKPRFFPCEMGPNEHSILHVSFHQLHDVAKTVSVRDGFAPYWVITVEPPLTIENVMPFPLTYQLFGQAERSSNLASSPLHGVPTESLNADQDVMVGRGDVSQCLMVNPQVNQIGKEPWKQNLSKITAYQVLLNLSVCKASSSSSELEIVPGSPEKLPVVFGERHQEEPTTEEIFLTGAYSHLSVKVEIVHRKSDDEDPDHKHFHEDTGNGDRVVMMRGNYVDDDEEDEEFNLLDYENDMDFVSNIVTGAYFVRPSSNGLIGNNQSNMFIPSTFHAKSMVPVRVIVYCPVLILNWSGLHLDYTDDKQKKQAKSKVAPMNSLFSSGDNFGASNSNSGSSTITSSGNPKKELVKIDMFSPKEDKMSISLADSESGWSKRFGLAIGMSGEVTIPPLPKHDVVHQVGVAVAAAPGRYLRTKVVTITPRFMIVNKTNWTVRLAQIGAPKDSWTFQLEPRSLSPFHPLDVNGDRQLDAKDFSVRLGLFPPGEMYDETALEKVSNDSCLGISGHFRLDIVKRNLLKMRPINKKRVVALIPCTRTNSLSMPLVQPHQDSPKDPMDKVHLLLANVELVDNVVRLVISKCSKERTFDYRIDNLSSFVRVGVVQQGCPRSTMVTVDADRKNVEWVWENPDLDHKVDVLFETIGLGAMEAFPRNQRVVASMNFDKVGDLARLKHDNMELEISIHVEGLTKVLVVDDMARAKGKNKVRKTLSRNVTMVENRLHGAKQKRKENLVAIDFKSQHIEVNGSSGSAIHAFDGNPMTTWRHSHQQTDKEMTHWVSCNFEPYFQKVDGYGFTIPKGGSENHPKKWRLLGKIEPGASWTIVDERDFLGHHHRSELSYYILEDPTMAKYHYRTLFKLPPNGPLYYSLKLEISHAGFDIQDIQLYRELSSSSSSKLTLKRQSSSSTPTSASTWKYLWVGLMEAQDLPIADMYTSDPYVVMKVGSETETSKVVNSTVHPVFDQEFCFSIGTGSNVASNQVTLDLYDKDMFSKSDFLCSASFHVRDFKPLLFGEVVDNWIFLKNQQGNPAGQIRLAMRLLEEPIIVNQGSYVNCLRFNQLYEAEVQILRRLRQKVVSEGGVLLTRRTSSVYPDEQETGPKGGSTNKGNSGDDAMMNQRKLSVTVLEANGLLKPHTVLRNSSRTKKRHQITHSKTLDEVYCVITYGDHSLRTDPAPLDLVSAGVEEDETAACPPPPARGEFTVKFYDEGPIGLQIRRTYQGEYVVGAIASNSQASRYTRIKPGVELVRLGNTEVTDGWNLNSVRSVLANSPRPFTVTFDDEPLIRMSEEDEKTLPRCKASWMQQIMFHEVDTMRAMGKELSSHLGYELESKRARIAIYARDKKNEPTFDVRNSYQSDRKLLVPLLYLFGDDVEVDAELRENQENYGDCDVLLGECTIVLPDVEERRRTIYCDLDFNGICSGGTIKLEIGWNHIGVDPAQLINYAVDVKLAGFGISLLDTKVRKTELAYVSITGFRLYISEHMDGRQIYDFLLENLQIDNQMANAVHPIILYGAPLPYLWIRNADLLDDGNYLEEEAVEYAQQLPRDNPSMAVTLVMRNGGDGKSSDMSYVEYFDFYLQEINFRLEESWLTAMQDFAASFRDLSEEGDKNYRSSNTAQSKQVDGEEYLVTPSSDSHGLDDHRKIWQAFSTTNPMAWVENTELLQTEIEEPRILIERADIKPVKINLTFSMTSDREMKSENRLKILHLMQGVPLLSAFASALVNTVANITDAPIRFNSLQIFNEGMSKTMLQTTFSQHIVDQLFSNLAQMGNLIASADLLGSPVQLIGSFGKGAYSFFYEPALALSMGGYMKIGVGLQKGGTELLRTTTHSLAYTFEKFAETASRALTQVSLDKKYIYRQAIRRSDVVHEPINIAEGVLSGTLTFGIGVLDGVTGVVRLPYRGLRHRGLIGLLSGTGRGVVGFFVKPFCASFDASALVLKGVCNSTEILERRQLPIRLQRFFSPGIPLGPYFPREAIGFHILKYLRLEESQTYVYHEYVSIHSGIRGGVDVSRKCQNNDDNDNSRLRLLQQNNQENMRRWGNLGSSNMNTRSVDSADFNNIGGDSDTDDSAENQKGDNFNSGSNTDNWTTPSVVYITNKMIMLVRMDKSMPTWACPLDLVDGQLVGRSGMLDLTFSDDMVQVNKEKRIKMGVRVRCKTNEEAHFLMRLVQMTKEGRNYRAEIIAYEKKKRLAMSKLALTDPVGAFEAAKEIETHMLSLFSNMQDNVTSPLAVRESNNNNRGAAIRGLMVRDAVIINRRQHTATMGDVRTQYQIVVASAETDDIWFVWRRYSEFRTLRNHLMKQLGKSRTALPIPSRLPWRLTEKSLNQRQLGLNSMLRMIMQSETLSENPLVRAFLAKDAEIIENQRWETWFRQFDE